MLLSTLVCSYCRGAYRLQMMYSKMFLFKVLDESQGIVFYKFLLFRAAVIVGALVGIRIGQQEKFAGRAAGDFFEYPVEGSDVVKAAV